MNCSISPLDVAAQMGEVGREGRDAEDGHAVGDAALDVVALGLGEDHAGAPVEKSQTLRNSSSVTAGISLTSAAGRRDDALDGDLDAEGEERIAVEARRRNGSATGKASGLPISASTSTAAAQTFISVSPLEQLAQQPVGFVVRQAARQLAAQQPHIGVGIGQQDGQVRRRDASGIARRASRAPVRRLASSDRR